MNTFQQIERISLEIDMKCRELAIFMNSNEFNSINELCKKRYDELISKQKEFFNFSKKETILFFASMKNSFIFSQKLFIINYQLGEM